MAHFAKIENGIVTQVIVIDNNDILDKKGKESEKIGQDFIASIGLEGNWIQTSYNGNPINKENRGPYAGIGYAWDGTKFIAPEIIEFTTE